MTNATRTITVSAFESQALAIMNRLEIKTSALAIKEELTFLLSKGMSAETNLTRMKLLSELSAQRKTLLDETRFGSFEEFSESFNENQTAALETLFCEYFQSGKMNRFYQNVGSDLLNLYTLHTQNPYDRFMKVLEAC